MDVTTLSPGTRLGPYELGPALGSGGVGVVYRALDTRLGRHVAIKLLREDVIDASARERFQHEARSLAMLSHPNVVSLFDVGSDVWGPYLVTELLGGMTLRERLNAHRPISTSTLATELAAGIAAAHRQGLVHRDLKPENVFITDEGRVKVLDLGLAQLGAHPGPSTPSRSWAGTSGYMAPEQLRGHRATFRSDVFSFGAIVYEVCAGHPAFAGGSRLDRAYRTLTHHPSPLEGEPLWPVLSRCLKKDPAGRFASGEELLEAIAEVETGLPSVRRPLRTELPVQTTSFVGRESELLALEALFDDPGVRLITITGAGGTGKTRLAIQLAERLRARGEPVTFVSLAPVRDPALVPKAIARAIGLADTGQVDPLEAVAVWLADEPRLIVLDNFEHLLPAASGLGTLISGTGALRILVTSRARLHLRGERAFPLGPMAAPAEDEAPDRVRGRDAVRLFSERAQRVDPSFSLDGPRVSDVAAICRRLDGLPLALELAAAHLRLLSTGEVRARLEREPPLALLTGGPTDVPEHQRTLRSTFAWSYELLGIDAQRLFRAASVFAGGFTVEAALAVSLPELAPDRGLAALEELADHSLVQRRTGSAGPRLLLLETVREYAHERLVAAGEEPAIRARHAQWAVALVEALEPMLRTSDQPLVLARLEDEHPNVRVALGWALAHDPGLLARLAIAATPFWQLHGYWQEGQRWLEQAREAGGAEDPSTLARLLLALGTLTWNQGSLAIAQQALTEAVALYRKLDDPTGLGLSQSRLGYGLVHQGELEESERLCAEAVAIFERTGDRRSLAEALLHLAGALSQTQISRANAVLERSLALLRDDGDPALIANVRNMLGEVARIEGRIADAERHYRDSIALSRQVGFRRMLGAATANLAAVLERLGETSESAELIREAMRVNLAIGNRLNAVVCLIPVAGLALNSGRPERALALVHECRRQVQMLGAVLDYADRFELERIEQAALARLGDVPLAAEGERSFDQAMQLALGGL